MLVEERYDLWSLATFIPNKNLPIHNWFHFKEGFSRELVRMLCSELGVDRGGVVLDPFVGSGTTTLTCMELGIESIGIDASPLAVLISYAKTRRYNPEKLRSLLHSITSKPFVRVGLNDLDPFTVRAFSRPTLEEILSLREHISEIDDVDYRAFFTLALMNSAMKCSYVYKDGSELRIVKRHAPPLKPFFKRTVEKMILDVERVELKAEPAYITLGDARDMRGFIKDESVDAVITSPPYLNKIEYTKVYAVELDLFLREHRSAMMRSYIGLTPRRLPSLEIGEDELPDSARAYLADMRLALAEMSRVLRKGGRAALVVAGGVYPDRVVEVDVLLAKLAERVGLEAERVRVINRRVATASRTKKIGEARESILYLFKH